MARSILDVANLLGISGPTWRFGLMILAVFSGLPLTTDQEALFHKHTGRTKLFAGPVRELWLAWGRRAGKSRLCALIAVFLACFVDHSAALAPGEAGVVMLTAPSQRQARVLLQYVIGFLRAVPFLSAMIVSETDFTIELKNGIVVEVRSGDFKRVRGFTIVAAIVDEIAFLPSDESMVPDAELLNALRPAMATVPNSVLICSSTLHGRKGEIAKAHAAHFGNDGSNVAFFNASSLVANPSLDPSIVAEAFEADPLAASSEYGAHGFVQFRSDLESFVSRDAVGAATEPGCFERPPITGIQFTAFVDPSGGSSDSFTLAVAHTENGVAVLDAIRERRPPFSPDAVCEDFAALIRSYGASTRVFGDAYAGLWPRERFRAHGVRYEVANETRCELYLLFLPLLNSGRARLLDHARLASQLFSLERRVARSGRESVDHLPGGHDDVANAVCGALVCASLLASKLVPKPIIEVIECRAPFPSLANLDDPFNDFGFDSPPRRIPSFGR